MGLIDGMMTLLFGSGRNVIRDTAEVFRENAEAGAVRAAAHQDAALAQFAAEFAQARVGRFDRMMDGLNRLPRPLLAFGTIGLMAMAMVDPIWFAARMQGIALVPEPLWWLMGAIVSFYFGARHQAKSQAFQSSISQTLARAPQVRASLADLQALAAMPPDGGASPQIAARYSNPVLADWQARRDE
ncbi:carboxylesterase [Pacificitalea manganoxidans]|uniref:Carboxylesterase n=1 Tax=Pacificitalea manganoxidans TaxID=1411902 RepID=A0A291LZQ8_9RHOB|nr:holin family protein [Pacificitalea manganoxidans]ATI42233.1 carboxylesterase [Pacificitalea manganoxidans]MDR6307950.1 hypothetical protein [Pacificitalea manganoxidans]